MLDITKYKKDWVIHIGKNVRNPLNLIQGQYVYLYEDIHNTQIVLTKYPLKHSLYHSILIFNNIEDFVNFGNDLSENGINMFSNSFHEFGNKYRMSMIFEHQEYKASPDWAGKSLINTFQNVAHKHNTEVEDIYWCLDEKIEKVKNIFLPLIKLSDLDDNIPKRIRITTNYTFYHNLSKEFRKRAQLNKSYEYKCVQIANPEAGVITLTFHNANVEKTSLKYFNLPGSLVRIINIFRELNMKVIASNNQVISSTLGGSAESLYAIEYPSKIKEELLNLKEKELREKILSILIDIDSNLAKENSSHQKIVSSHNNLLNTLGLEMQFFITDVHLFQKNPQKNSETQVSTKN